jgi:hypothetical protein
MRLAELKAERSRHSLVGPIILTAAGFSAALVFAAVAASDTSDDPDDDFSPATGTSLDDDEDHRGAVIAGSVLAVLSAGVGVGGLVWLLRRKKARKAHDGEIEQLKLRQEQLRLQGVSYSFAVDPVGGRLLLRARF